MNETTVEISKIQLPDGTTCTFKDDVARKGGGSDSSPFFYDDEDYICFNYDNV